MTIHPADIILRSEVLPSDLKSVEEIVASSGFFRPDEIRIAVELVNERLDKGPDSGYEFIFAEINHRVVSYGCFGLIPCTINSYDFYWLATHEDYRGKGIGKMVLTTVEKAVTQLGGTGLYIETSGQSRYEPTRAFYLKNHYIEKAKFEDFYDIGDDKIVYVKRL